jgi:mannitol/fructose-specific phosphotransferase system IIA component
MFIDFLKILKDDRLKWIEKLTQALVDVQYLERLQDAEHLKKYLGSVLNKL